MNEIALINLTPHEINIYDAEGERLLVSLPSKGEARCEVVRELSHHGMFGVPEFATAYGKVEGLPREVPGTTYVVSLLVRQALPHRLDLASPGELIRDDRGKPVGCKGLDING